MEKIIAFLFLSVIILTVIYIVCSYIDEIKTNNKQAEAEAKKEENTCQYEESEKLSTLKSINACLKFIVFYIVMKIAIKIFLYIYYGTTAIEIIKKLSSLLS